MTHRLKNTRRGQTGFTIVELLIVVVVIAILAAITIVAYNGIAQRAKESSAQSAASQAMKKLALYAVENNSYPLTLESLGISSNGVSYQYTANNSTTPKGYCVTATTGGVSYYLGENYTYTVNGGGTVNQPTPTAGACPGHSTNGVAIKNLKPNPSMALTKNTYGTANGSVLTRDTTRFRSAPASLNVVMPVYGPNQVGTSLYTASAVDSNTTVKPNATYTVSAYVYVPAGTVDLRLLIQGAAKASSSDLMNTTALKDQWVRISNTFATGATGNISLFVVNMTDTTVNGTQFWVDDVMITEGTALPLLTYADGYSPGWSWDGTEGESSSSGPAL